jgi:hypothetical protein
VRNVAEPVAGLALGAAVVAGAGTDPVVLLVAVLLVQALVVLGWHRSLDVPGAVGGVVVGVGISVAADLVVLAQEGERPLAALPVVLGLTVPVALVHQLGRRGDRSRLIASLSSVVTAAVLAALGSTYLGLDALRDGAPMVAVAAAAASLVGSAAVVRRRLDAPDAVDAAAIGVGLLAAPVVAAVTDMDLTAGLALAAVAAIVAWAGTVLAARTAHPDPFLAAALPLAIAGPAAYVLGRLLGA